MTNRLENEANIWRNEGFEGVAQAIELARDLAKDAGAPESFGPDSGHLSLNLIREKIGEVLSTDFEGPEYLNDFAASFNNTLGAELPDNTPIKHLLPHDGTSRRANVLPQDNINSRLRAFYTRAINGVWYAHISTVGDLRSRGKTRFRNAGDKSADFLYQAFKTNPAK
jgi:hypothetical protein